MENKMAAINHPKELLFIPAYQELSPSCRLMLFEMAAFGGSGRIDAFIQARGRDDKKSFEFLANNGFVEVEDISFRLTCDFIKTDNPNERMKKSRLAKKDMLSVDESCVTLQTIDAVKGVCPYEEIKTLYNNILGPYLGKVLTLSTQRKAAMKMRWREVFDVYNQNTKHNALKFFDWYFTVVSKSDFLCGRNKNPSDKFGNWKASFDYLMKADKMLRIYEDEYNASKGLK